MRARLIGRPIQSASERTVENLVHEGRLTRAADARHGDEQTERESDVEVFEIVGGGALHEELSARGCAAHGWHLDRTRTGEVLAGE